MPYRITAYDAANGEAQTSAEILGDTLGRIYQTREQAEAVAETMTQEAPEYGLPSSLRYEVAEARMAPISPPLRTGQLVQCSRCRKMVGDARVRAILDEPAGSFICGPCLNP